MSPPPPPEEIAQLMQFIAEKVKNVKSPMNIAELCRQFKEATGSSVVLKGIKKHRQKIHEMDEFEMKLKVKLIFALSAPIDAGFLVEMKKVADVEVDHQQRIIHYKQKDGELEFSAKYIKLSMDQAERRDREIIQFLADKSKTTDKPISDRVLLREFKEKRGYKDKIATLEERYRRLKRTIYRLTEVDVNTKIKIMFISNVKLSDETLNELRKDADVEVDEEGRIKKYKANNGSLEFEGSHGLSTSMKSFQFNRWQTIFQKVDENESEEDDDEDRNCQKDYAKKRIDLVRFLINRTRNATSPLSIKQLAKDYKKESKSSESFRIIDTRIRRFRQRIREMNQFDKPTKIRMLFALSVPIDAKLLKELQNDAIVELDENQRIKRHKANDGSLGLEGDHSWSAKAKAGWANARNNNKKKRSVANDLSESEDDGDKEDRSESVESEEEEDEENVGKSTRSNQNPTSSAARRSDRLRNTRTSIQNKNKKRQLPEKNSDSPHTRNHARMSRGKKRARISYSSSETSEEEPPGEGDDDDIDYNPLSNHRKNERNRAEDMDYETTQEVEKRVPKEASTKNDENSEHIGIGSKPVMDHIPMERKPENLIEVKTEVPEEPSGGENSLIEPKIEECTREVKQEVEEDEEGPSTSSTVKIESMSLLELLNHLRSPIAQYTPALVHRMDERIKKLKSEDQQIPFNIVLESLEMCIQLLNTLEEMDSDENTTSLPNFFYRLGTAMCTINHPSMDDFYLKIKKFACTADKKVSLEHIRYVMGKTLDRILI